MMRRVVYSPIAAMALAALAACAAPQVRPETAVITSSVEEVWVAFIEILKGSGFELESAEPSHHTLRAEKESIFAVSGSVDPMQRFGRAARKQHHDVSISMRPRDDQATVIEIRYTIDKVADEEAGFALIGAVRERLALEQQ